MTTLAIGTEKGAYLLTDDGGAWSVEQLFPGWRVTAFGKAADGTYLAGAASGWFGPSVHTSPDLVEWTQVVDGPAYPEDGPDLEQIWTFTTAPDGRVWCGVAQAGLFTSDDHGRSWQPVEAFNGHPTRPRWEPGAGGLCTHRILLDGDRVWAAASAVGVFRSDDAGATFIPRNTGLGIAVPGGEAPEVGSCVHALVADPGNPDLLWMQNHMGVFRSTDGADSWERIEQGLPANFGFPIGRDAASGSLFIVPLDADVDRTPVDGDFAVWRSTDAGDTWHRSGEGWPEAATYDSVLRGAMATDGDGGVVIGTTGGQIWATEDAGDHWTRLPGTFPRIDAVAVL
ncbi:exo-alpha-sialidase [Euzebya sp.]|uniref:exo-alpha-sialidase n=1 Tax=Euzebya sp. TaxID=1971409 RepID=UPI003517E80E